MGTLGRLQVANCLANQGKASAVAQTAALTADLDAIPAWAATYWKRPVCDADLNYEDPS